MKIAVIGCGSLGCYFGSKLSLKNEVVYIDTFQKTVDNLNNFGITIKEDDVCTNYNAPAFLTGKYDQVVDLVLLAVKSTQNVAALNENSAIINENTLVVSLQNGFGNEREIKRHVDLENIVIGNTKINFSTDDEGIVKKIGDGITEIGTIDSSKKNSLIVKVLFNQAGIKTEVAEDIKKVVWEKMFVSATLNPLTAIFNCKMRVVYENKNIWQLLETLVKELVLVAKHDGYEFDVQDVLELIKTTIFNIGKGYTVMHQDVLNKRFTEVEKLNGQIAFLAYRYGIESPYNDFVLNSIKAIEKLY